MHSGMVIRLKNGAPTLTLAPLNASAASGYSVPSSTVIVNAVSSRLLIRKTVSRDATASRFPRLVRLELRPARSTSETTSPTAMNARK